MLVPTLTQIIEEALEDLKRKDPLRLVQELMPLIKDLYINEPKLSQHDSAIFEEFKHPLYQLAKQLERLKAFISSKGLEGAITSEINEFFSSELNAGLVKDRLEMLIFNNSIRIGKKRIGAYVSNVYYII
ncbi:MULTISPECIES: hypothetical protein [Acinetobacter]|uniref:hypothetical protein n=1 Tax=Acinetobacter TaxID=469 RepID=UPI00257D5758|nr:MULTISPECIES: hypothetical protein [Acinetobacter]